MALYKHNTLQDYYIVAYKVNLSDKNKDRYNWPERMVDLDLDLTINAQGKKCLQRVDDKRFGQIIAFDGDYISFNKDGDVYAMEGHIFERRYTLVDKKILLPYQVES